MRLSQHGQPWTEHDDRIVYDRFTSDVPVADIAAELRRNTGGIRARLKRLGLLDSKGKPVVPPPPFSPTNKHGNRTLKASGTGNELREIEVEVFDEDQRYSVEYVRDMMSARLYNILQRLQITDVRQAFRQPPQFFLRQKNFGRRTLHDLQNLERALAREAEMGSGDLKLAPAGVVLGREEETSQALLESLENVITDIRLPDRDNFILIARLGLVSGYERVTLATLGQLYSISRERVRQIQKKTLRRLHHRLWRDEIFERLAESLFPQPSDTDILHFCERHFSYPLSRHMAVLLALKTGLYKKYADAAEGIASAGWVIRAEKRREARSLVRQERHLQRHLQLFRGAFNPPKFRPFSPPVAEFSRKREINEDSIGRTGSFFSKKCQREVCFESNEEYLTYQIMEGSAKVVWYQEQPLLIPFHFFAKSYSYCPDLAVVTDEGNCFVIEVKAREGLIEVVTLRKALAAISYLHPKGIGISSPTAGAPLFAILRRRRFPRR